MPANYGGFETCAEEIAVGLVQRGHEVTAYCRPGNAEGDPSEYKGVRLVYCNLTETKSLGTITHTRNSLRHALKQDFDILMVFNAGNSPLCVLPKMKGAKFAINVDGLEWKRAKWGKFVKIYYQFAEWTATKLAGRIVSDSRAIQAYYADRFKTPSTFIAYGAHVEHSENPDILKEYDLEPGSYLFVASRLEPENNADTTVAAFEKVKTDKKLVIAGGANWNSPFVESIKKTTDPRIQFLGPVYKDGHIKELHCNCYAYVHGNEVGGTNPALLKALGYGNCVLSLDVNFNAEVVQDAALLYKKDPDDLAEKMQRIIDDPELAQTLRERGVARIREAYQWDRITEDYERMFENLMIDHYKSHPESD